MNDKHLVYSVIGFASMRKPSSQKFDFCNGLMYVQLGGMYCEITATDSHVKVYLKHTYKGSKSCFLMDRDLNNSYVVCDDMKKFRELAELFLMFGDSCED